MIAFGIPDVLFQQANALVHKVYSVMDWLEDNNIDVIEHSLYLPDLNSIEHVWVELKKRLHQQYFRIADTPEGKEAVKKKLANVPLLVWDTIHSEFFEKLGKCMPNRIVAILIARGEYTKY